MNQEKFHFFWHHNPIYTGRAVSGLWQFQAVSAVSKIFLEKNLEKKFRKIKNKNKKVFKNKNQIIFVLFSLGFKRHSEPIIRLNQLKELK